SEKATVNGQVDVPVLKLGTSSKLGSATVKIPAGKSSVSFYAYAWKGKSATLSLKMGETVIQTLDLKSNDGCANSSPYTITADAADKYTIPFGSALSADVEVTVETTGSSSNNGRAIIFAVKAE
ncbi:MAG: hypothetical protein PUA96_00825, partial [Bacteroidales bacterium]|nr:hypothetical protein [Bacteroidales bacterium]